jgi:hypothetical protein
MSETMKININKKLFTISIIGVWLLFVQTFAQQTQEPPEPPKNLKVLPKKTSAEDVRKIMKVYSKSLGVRCGFCHAAKVDDPKKYDFASDAKPNKETARKMMKMTAAINKRYLKKIGKGLYDEITCVTCHMGKSEPKVSVDSLPAIKK